MTDWLQDPEQLRVQVETASVYVSPFFQILGVVAGVVLGGLMVARKMPDPFDKLHQLRKRWLPW